ncbi:MAG: PAS domain S-box protein [Rhodocyclales bacterium]|nr:PAS domain S-box protein [Rhodocyclales bacterium]
MFSIPIQTAIVNSIIGNAVLAGIFLYLWRVDKRENALGYWAAAYAASACRVSFRLIGLEGYPAAIYGEALFGTISIVLLWMGTRAFIGKPSEAPWKVGLVAAAGMGGVAGLAAVGAIPIVIPYLIAGVVYFLAGLALLRRGREHPGVGYSIIGFLFALYGGYVFVFSHLASSPQDPRSYIFGPIINLAMGMVLLVVTQRKQQSAAEKLSDALLREAEGRRVAEDVGIRSEQRYRAIVDTTRSLIGLLTPEGTLIDVNRTALERAGIQLRDVVGKPFWETPWWAHDAEQQQRLKQAIRRVAAGGHDRFESSHRGPDGGIDYFNFFLTPIRDAAGQVVFLVPEAHDISVRRRMEQSLHAAEQRFRAISEGSMLGVFATDDTGKVTYFSRRATEVTGITEPEAIDGRLAERVHPEDLDQHRAQWRTAIVERKPFVAERRYVRRDGGISWGRIHVAPILEGENLRGFVGTIEDINARKQAEQALRDSEERFSSFFSLSPVPNAVAQYPNGEYIQVNEAWERTFGFKQSEVVGRSALDLGLWEHPEDRRRLYEDIVRRNQARSGEIRMRRKNGDTIYVTISARVLTVGQSRLILWNTHDVSERRRMEEALRASEERLSKTFNLLPDLVTVSSLDEGRFVDMNHQWEAMMGYTREEAIGKPTAELGIWVYPEQRLRLIEEVMRDGTVRGREITARRKDGRQIVCEASGSTFDWHGQRLLMLVIRDVTAQRQIEQARAAAEESLRENEEKFATFFALGPEPMAVVRFEDAVYADVNEAWLRKFGYAREEVIGRTPQELGFWEDFAERRKVIDMLGRDGRVEGAEVWYKSKDGRRVLANIAAKVFELSGTRYVLWDVHDITEKRKAEIQLRTSEAKFSKAFHSSPDYMTISRLSDGIVLDCNEAFERFTGYGRAEAINRSTLDLGIWSLPGERARFAEILGQQGWLRDFECTLRGRDGRVMTSLVTASTIDIDGEECVIAVARDVSAQRRMEQELRASEEMFSTIFHQLPVAIAVTTREEGRYVDVNLAWSGQFGYSRDEVVGRTGRELNFWVNPDDRAKLAEHLGHRPDFFRREIAFRAKDGRAVLTECSGRLFTIGGEEVVIWGAPDITERKRIEQALREGEEKFSAIFRRSPVALGVTSVPEGRYLDVNESWERQFRYSRNQMMDRTSLDIGLWRDSGERRRLFADLDANPQVQNREVHFIRGDGKEILCELSGQIFELNGRKVLLWGAHDVTEHRRAQREIEELNLKLEARVLERTSKLERANAELEEAVESLKLAQHELVRAEKLAALGSLVAGVAHELNTPIGNSVTVASTLHDKTRDFSQSVESGKLRRSTLDNFLEDANTASELLLRSLTQANDLVSSFKQVAVDQASAQRRRFDLKVVAEEVAATLSPMLKKTPFKLELELADNITMDSYPGSIGQVITNLVTNSLAHAFEGREGGVMHLRTRRRGPHLVEMAFADDGVGISASDMKRVFDPFFTTKLGRGGSGLGLHIVYNLVTRVLGGRIQAASHPGSGTRFQISLPVKAPAKGEPEA